MKELKAKVLVLTIELEEIARECHSPERFFEAVSDKFANNPYIKIDRGVADSYNIFKISLSIKNEDVTHTISSDFEIKYRDSFNDSLVLKGPANQTITKRSLNEAQKFDRSPYTDLTFIEDAVDETIMISDRYSGSGKNHYVNVFSDGSFIITDQCKVLYVSGDER